MSEFSAYLGLGFEHISDINGYDHILFIVATCAVYRPRQWKTLLWLVTAFTFGHSITLALAVSDVLAVPSALIEFLIPVTIFITSLYNLWKPASGEARKPWFKYTAALLFGLIHGMGFSNYLKILLGKADSIFQPLLAFNIGLEFGQLLIVGLGMLASGLVLDLLGRQQRDWVMVLSGATAGIALILMKETFAALIGG